MAYKEVYGIVRREGQEKGFWTRIGVGFVNKDGSMNIKFDYLPTSHETTIQMRDPKPETENMEFPPQEQTTAPKKATRR